MSTPGLFTRLSTLFGTSQTTQELDTCAICLESLDTDKEAAHKTPCGHTFHTKCYIRHLLTEDIRCPLCRTYPDPMDYRNRDRTSDTVDEATSEESIRVSRKEAWTSARRSQDVRVKRSLVTIQKWRIEARKAADSLVRISEVLDREEDLIDDKVRLYKRKLTTKYQSTYNAEIAQKKAAEKDLERANRAMNLVEMRLLAKFGYRRRRFSTQRRRRRRD